MTSKVKIVLRNPLNKSDTIDYTIESFNHKLSCDWIEALKKLLQSDKMLEKNYCFMGFPNTSRTLEYLCAQANESIKQINLFNMTETWTNAGLSPYVIEDYFVPDVVRFSDDYPIGFGNDHTALGLSIKHTAMNQLHNHFERLQGTVWGLSGYYKHADYDTKYAIRQLNNLCHEMETLILSQRKQRSIPEWVRPSQITTWLTADRYDLLDEHRDLFSINGYDRVFGGVYMHWTQIGKTLFEVFRDEGAPRLTIGDDPTDIRIGSGATCEAITSLKYYSGEFDIEWGNDVVYGGNQPWHTEEQDVFKHWLQKHEIDYNDPKLSLGYLPIGQVKIKESFGVENAQEVWKAMSPYLDIYKVEVDGISQTYDYCWSDPEYKQMQIDMLRPGYDYQMRNI